MKKNSFDQLGEACHKARLSQPRLFPMGDRGWWKVEIPGHYSTVSKDHEDAITRAATWVSGFVAGQETKDIIEVDTPQTYEGCVIQAAVWAKQVLSIEGNGGPDDHETLAKAIIVMCEGLLRRKHGDKQATD